MVNETEIIRVGVRAFCFVDLEVPKGITDDQIKHILEVESDIPLNTTPIPITLTLQPAETTEYSIIHPTTIITPYTATFVKTSDVEVVCEREDEEGRQVGRVRRYERGEPRKG